MWVSDVDRAPAARVRPRPSQPSSRRLGRRRNGNREPAPALFAAAHRAHPGTGPVPQPGTGHCGSYRCGERPGTADRGGTGRPVHRRRREGRPYRRRSTGTGDHRYRGTAARATRYRYRGHRYRPPAHPKPRWSYRPAGRSASPATTAITTRTVTATAAAGLAEHTAVTDPPARVPRRAGGQERRPHYPRPAPSPGSGFRMLSWDVTPSTAAGCGRDRTCPNSPRFPGLPRATAGPDRVPALARRRQIHPPSPCVTGCSAPAGCGTCTPGRPNDCGTTPGTRRTGTGGQCPRTGTGEADSRSVGESPLPVTGTDRATAGTSTTERYRYDRAVPVERNGTRCGTGRTGHRYRAARTGTRPRPVPGRRYRVPVTARQPVPVERARRIPPVVAHVPSAP